MCVCRVFFRAYDQVFEHVRPRALLPEALIYMDSIFFNRVQFSFDWFINRSMVRIDIAMSMGLGLFANETILKGQCFQVYGGQIVRRSDINRFDNSRYDLQLKGWGLEYVIDGSMFRNLPESFQGAAANHSINPNAIIVWKRRLFKGMECFFPVLTAKLNISLNEQITLNYGSLFAKSRLTN